MYERITFCIIKYMKKGEEDTSDISLMARVKFS
jgi:hypothetical protein